jgi:hypothetical protein
MKFLTERSKGMAEAALELQRAHEAGDRQAYLKAIEAEEAAKSLPDLYHCVSCGREWAGNGRATIGYITLYELDDDHKEATFHQRHERGSEHTVTWCPDCKHKVFEHTSKR